MQKQSIHFVTFTKPLYLHLVIYQTTFSHYDNFSASSAKGEVTPLMSPSCPSANWPEKKVHMIPSSSSSLMLHGKAKHQWSFEERNSCEAVKLIVIGNERKLGIFKKKKKFIVISIIPCNHVQLVG